MNYCELRAHQEQLLCSAMMKTLCPLLKMCAAAATDADLVLQG